MSKKKIIPAVVFVTAEMAARWLKANFNNRPVREARIAKYADDMREGRWTFAGDPIRFDADGNLIDGQHRLMALRDSGVDGITFLVVRGLPTEAQSVMDQGAKRTPADQLAMRGMKNTATLAAAVKQYLLHERGLLFRDTKVGHAEISSPQIEEWCREHSIEVEHFTESCHHIRASGGRPSVAGAAFFVFEQVDAAAAAEFFFLLATGAGTQGHPIVTLDRKLRRWQTAKTKVTQRDELAVFIQAWNAWRSNKTVANYNRPTGGHWTAETFPKAA